MPAKFFHWVEDTWGPLPALVLLVLATPGMFAVVLLAAKLECRKIPGSFDV